MMYHLVAIKTQSNTVQILRHQVALVTIADLISKLGFGFYLMFAVLDQSRNDDIESEDPSD